MNIQFDILVMLPELILAIGAMALLLVGAIGGEKTAPIVSGAAIALLVASGAAIVLGTPGPAFHGAFLADGFARFADILILIGAGFSILMAEEFFSRIALSRFELPVLMLLATLGMLLMVSASSFLSLYMGLELQSLALYVLAAFNRDHLRSTEAGLKYFVLGALSSGMLLYGASLVYGMTGTVSFSGIAAALKGGAGIGAIFGLAFVLAGLSFKISAVPFHMWTPDVYEGAPTPVTAFFAVAPKTAAVALLVRVVEQAFPSITGQWQQIIVFVAIASTVLGAFAAIGQTNIKRLLAYSSIGHIGYVLIGLSAGTVDGVAGVATYMAIYIVTTLGAFACVLSMERNGHYCEDINDLAGLSRTNPALAFAFAMIMFSLAGIPPLAGFFAKWYVFAAAVHAGLNALAVVGVVASVVGAFYYLRIVKIIYFDEPKEAFTPAAAPVRLIAALAAVLVVAFALAPASLVEAANFAARSLF